MSETIGRRDSVPVGEKDDLDVPLKLSSIRDLGWDNGDFFSPDSVEISLEGQFMAISTNFLRNYFLIVERSLETEELDLRRFREGISLGSEPTLPGASLAWGWLIVTATITDKIKLPIICKRPAD